MLHARVCDDLKVFCFCCDHTRKTLLFYFQQKLNFGMLTCHGPGAGSFSRMSFTFFRSIVPPSLLYTFLSTGLPKHFLMEISCLSKNLYLIVDYVKLQKKVFCYNEQVNFVRTSGIPEIDVEHVGIVCISRHGHGEFGHVLVDRNLSDDAASAVAHLVHDVDLKVVRRFNFLLNCKKQELIKINFCYRFLVQENVDLKCAKPLF